VKRYNNILEIAPELLQILETAVKKQPSQEDPWIIQLPDKAKAVSMRQRLYSVRRKLIEDKYPGCVDFNRLEFSVSRQDGSLLIYVPSWLRAVQKSLTDEGVEVKPILADELVEEVPAEDSAQTKALHELFSVTGGKSDGQDSQG